MRLLNNILKAKVLSFFMRLQQWTTVYKLDCGGNVGGVAGPEVHGSGYYYHYNDPKHYFHVWFGKPVKY